MVSELPGGQLAGSKSPEKVSRWGRAKGRARDIDPGHLALDSSSGECKKKTNFRYSDKLATKL